ncbi:hypothetical protein DFH06DRAFT_1128991 [Mycena polygramma]|nr:hypothetical protein DFH06DRAFT_1128991 [Mycena polygramma]
MQGRTTIGTKQSFSGRLAAVTGTRKFAEWKGRELRGWAEHAQHRAGKEDQVEYSRLRAGLQRRGVQGPESSNLRGEPQIPNCLNRLPNVEKTEEFYPEFAGKEDDAGKKLGYGKPPAPESNGGLPNTAIMDACRMLTGVLPERESHASRFAGKYLGKEDGVREKNERRASMPADPESNEGLPQMVTSWSDFMYPARMHPYASRR